MSSIMRARNGLTGRWEGSEVIRGSFLEPKVAGPSARDRTPRPSRTTAHHFVENALTQTPAPSRASGFVLRNLAVLQPRPTQSACPSPATAALNECEGLPHNCRPSETWMRTSWRVSGHQVVAVENSSGTYRRMVCSECPWRLDQTGKFPS